jgi:anti-sigma-K factor RskA
MQGTELDPNARGLLLIDDSDKQGLLILSGINPAPSGRIYQIWVMAERGPISVGAFNPGTSQRGSTWVDLSETPMQFASLEFTSEPEGGSTAPTSLPVCILRAQAY